MLKGIWKKLLRVDLSEEKITTEEIGEKLFEKYIGGSGLATKYLYDEVPAGTPALGSDNKIIFATGPFQGTNVPGSAKWSVVSRSPLTGTFSVSTAGAEWGVNFKKAGYDLLVVEGKSYEPVFLSITDQSLELRPAKELWGKDAIETVDLVQNKIDNPNASVSTIGPAGENKIGSACITADRHSFAGRTGMGAVLGSKKVKAIAVDGNKSVPIAQKDRINELNKKYFRDFSKNVQDTYKAHGTPNDVAACEELGDMPIRNWSQSSWPEGAEKIGAPNYTEELNAKSWPCKACPVGCHRRIKAEYKGEKIKGAGAEYETLGMMGSNCLVDDLGAISKANDLCNRLGLDTISVGSYAAFTMEAFERELITEKEVGEVPKWGNEEFVIDFVDKVGKQEDFGKLFKKGFESAIPEIGNEAEEIAVAVKNLALPAHDPRTHFSLAINYATSTRGACHLRGYPHVGELGAVLLPEIGISDPPEKFNMKGQAEFAAHYQDLATLQDSLVVCIFESFAGLTLGKTKDLFNAITGRNFTSEKLLEAGERAFNLQRKINVGDGIDRSEDRLPPRIFEPGEEGVRAGQIPEPFEKSLLEYYEYRGWTNNGIPKSNKLSELELI